MVQKTDLTVVCNSEDVNDSVTAAKQYLRAMGTAGYMDTKGMFKTTLTTASGASTRTWVYMVAVARPEALLGDSDT